MLKVEATIAQYFAIAGLGLFLAPLGAVVLVYGLINFNVLYIGAGLLCLVALTSILIQFFRGYFKSVKCFTNEGLTRNDGRQFAWTELQRVVNRIRILPVTTNFTLRGRVSNPLWRIDIHFRDGSTVWLIPPKISNFQEVLKFVNNLPCEHTQEKIW